MIKFDSKTHHRHSTRLKGYDYSQQGAYFITICTYGRRCLFGNVINKEMILNNLGSIVRDEWLKSGKIRAEIEIGAYVVMPNHLHAIVFIRDTVRATDGHPLYDRQQCLTTINKTSDVHRASAGHPYKLQRKSLGSLVAGFKSAATKRINEQINMFDIQIWQRNYHEHIIRDDKSFEKIYNYITNNPALWQEDCYFEK